jgi:hypothetical protein
MSAFENDDGPHWVDFRPTRTTADRHSILVALALRNRPEVTGRLQSEAGTRLAPAKVS